jgi:LytS/YehU family sensor histidine kinase
VQRLHETRLQRVEIERHLAEAKLQQLRAQIEPHFLFNSLASVKRLYEGDPGAGRALLADLVGYLRAATASAQAGRFAFARRSPSPVPSFAFASCAWDGA